MKTFLRSTLSILGIATCILAQPGTATAQNSFLNKLGLGSTTNATSVTNLAGMALNSDQVALGLKEALSKGVAQAITNLGRDNGFLTNIAVRIPMPENLQRIEKTLRSLKQEKMADEFVTTLNRAAEQAVPEAAAIFGDSLKQMTVADAKSILSGPADAATQYFRRTSTNALGAKFLPIVKTATDKAGVTASYKKMIDAAGASSLNSTLGSSLGSFGVKIPTAGDLDKYVTDRAMDGLFKMVANQEKLIRENPAARTTDLLKQVFGTALK
ncbi:MAG TPA: DUF4197 domain-containing protein [Roseimicrobium sp.]|nr:DUF4197 domain-containing protein [Roseimicrobium sp.]